MKKLLEETTNLIDVTEQIIETAKQEAKTVFFYQ